MRKILLVTLALVFFLNSCSFIGGNMQNRDERISNNLTEKIIEICENRNWTLFNDLFAKNAIKESENFLKNAQNLVSYYKGEFVSYENRGNEIEKTRIDSYENEIFYTSYDVVTTEGVFRIATKYITMDTRESDNVGLWSLFIISMEKDGHPDYAYRGDTGYPAGIYIDIQGTPPQEETGDEET